MEDDTSTTDDQTAVIDELVEEAIVEKDQQVNEDALDAISGGVKGELTLNDEVDEGLGEVDDDTESDGTGDSGNDDGSETEQAVEDSAEEVAEETESVDPENVFGDKNTPDPGEFKPNDYSFEVKTTDGKTVTINSPEDADSLLAQLDEKPDLISATQFGILSRKTALMEMNVESERKTFEANKANYEAEQALVNTRNEVIQQWDKEIKYLANSGEIPVISDKNNTANWADPEVAKDPAVKARTEIFKWMESENNKRLDAGLEPIKSVIDAHNAMQLEAMRNESRDIENKDKQTRRARGAMVGGDAPYVPEASKPGNIIGEGGSLNDLVTEFYATQ